jgi:hypothetical protein
MARVSKPRDELATFAVCAALFAVFALASCGDSPQKNETQSARQAQPGDVTTSHLPDSNYATPQLLAARKEGLAQESAELADPAKTGTIEPIAVDPYTRADYPDLVRKWGSLIPTINRERLLAAQIASRDSRCDGVTNAQITDHGSRADRHYMTECNNLTRIYFDTKSLSARRSAVVRTEADMGAQGVLDW